MKNSAIKHIDSAIKYLSKGESHASGTRYASARNDADQIIGLLSHALINKVTFEQATAVTAIQTRLRAARSVKDTNEAIRQAVVDLGFLTMELEKEVKQAEKPRARTLTHGNETCQLQYIKFSDPQVNAVAHVYSFLTQTSKAGATYDRVQKYLTDRLEYLIGEELEWAAEGYQNWNTEEIETIKKALVNLPVIYNGFDLDVNIFHNGMSLLINAFGRQSEINLMTTSCKLTIENIEAVVNDGKSFVIHS